MPYQYATERADYSDLASGKVLHSLPGHPAFPIRLASEMYQRCLARRFATQQAAPCVVYDPCCGAGYLLSVVAYLHVQSIGTLIGSDIDTQAVALAERNLSLLNLAGLEQRSAELEALFKNFRKASHREALESAQHLRQAVLSHKYPILTRVFQADATQSAALKTGLKDQKVDIVLTDVPYGQHSEWLLTEPGGTGADANPIFSLLEALRGCLVPEGVVAIAADKRQKIVHPAYQRSEHFQIGKRQVVVLKATSAC